MEDKTIRFAEYIIAGLGLAISIYLTLYHYAGVPLVCSDSGIINCASVLNSPYAYVFGIPVAVFGIIFFLAMLALLFINSMDAILIWNLIGIGTVVYLLDIERLVGHVCAWCTAVHIIVMVLLMLSLYRMIEKK
jgi:uncharacterized membrane protein